MKMSKGILMQDIQIRNIECRNCGQPVTVHNKKVESVVCSNCVNKLNIVKPAKDVIHTDVPELERVNRRNFDPKTGISRRGRKPGVGGIIAKYINETDDRNFENLCEIYRAEMVRQRKEKSEKQIRNNLHALLFVLKREGKI